MKLKYLLTGLLISMFCISSCQSPDDLLRGTEDENVNVFTVKGRLASNETAEYEAVIDKTAGTVVVQVPYYLSDTEEIMPDLTQVKLTASLPNAAKLEPSIAGVHDLTQPLNVRLVYETGEVENYEITARAVKSAKALITSATVVELPRMKVRVTEDKVLFYKTSSSMNEILSAANVKFSVSPWATVSVNENDVLDLNEPNRIVVTAQDGTEKVYTTEVVYPDFVPVGQVGEISLLFGFQPSNNNPRGFVNGKNRSLAVVGEELILGSQENKLVRYNRFTGAKLDKSVNVNGVITPGFFYAITTDDNGVLVGTSMAAAKNQWSANTMLEFYVWKNGLDSAPEKIYSVDIMTEPSLASFAPNNGGYDMGRTISVKGDIVSGKAQLMIVASSKKTVVRYKVENGKISGNPELIAVSMALGAASKAIPVTNEDNTPFVLSSASSARLHYYVNSDRSYVTFSPGNWWTSDTKGADYTEFNGVKLLAIQNGSYTGTVDNFNRLCVANITAMSPSSFTQSRVLDSRLENYDPTVLDKNGNMDTQNPTITGMTSYYVSPAEGGAVGVNGNKCGDVCFGASEDGTAVQVYMLTTDHGIIAYEISKFAPF